MVAGTVTEIKGKVLQAGIRRGETAMGKPYAFAWVQLLDRELREIVEVTSDVTDGRESPFVGVERGRMVAFPVGFMRLYGGMLTGALAVEEADGELDADGEAAS